MFGLVAAVEHVEVGLEVLHGERAASVAGGLHDLLVRVDRVALQEAARAAQVDDVVGGEREQAVLVRGHVEGVLQHVLVRVGLDEQGLRFGQVAVDLYRARCIRTV